MHPEPTLFHSYYNHHVETIEIIEQTVKQGVQAATNSLKDCVSCAQNLLKSIPDYIDSKMSQLHQYYDDKQAWLDYIPLKIKSLNMTSQLLSSSDVT